MARNTFRRSVIRDPFATQWKIDDYRFPVHCRSTYSIRIRAAHEPRAAATDSQRRAARRCHLRVSPLTSLAWTKTSVVTALVSYFTSINSIASRLGPSIMTARKLPTVYGGSKNVIFAARSSPTQASKSLTLSAT